MLSKEQVEEIVRLTIAQMGGGAPAAPVPSAPEAVLLRPAAPAAGPVNVGGWLYQDANAAVEAAWTAFQQFNQLSLEKRRELVEAMRQTARDNARHLSEMAHEETG